MITLTIICVIYTFFGFRSFKKQYGHCDLLNENPNLWIIMLLFSTIYSAFMSLILIVKFYRIFIFHSILIRKSACSFCLAWQLSK